MRLIVLLPVLYLIAILETALADVLSIGQVGPNLLALVAFVWVLQLPSPRVFLVAGAIGLIGDLIGPGRLGLGTGVFLLVGYGIARVQAHSAPDSIGWRMSMLWIAVSLTSVGIGVGRWLLGESAVAIATLLARGLGVGVYTAAWALPVLLVLKWTGESFALDEGPNDRIFHRFSTPR